MIVGIGTDIVARRRIESALTRFGDRFVRKILADEEIVDPVTADYLAKQFAAKEAVAKALGTGMGAGVSFSQIVVSRKRGGAPVVTLTSHAQARAEKLGVARWHLSIADEQDNAIAFAVAESLQ